MNNSNTMDKTGRKVKTKKPAAKPKKKKTEGPTCSMFLADLRRKFQAKKRQDEEKAETKNIVKMIVDSISHALPIKFSKTSSPKSEQSPVQAETLQSLQKYAAELQPNDVVFVEPPPELVTVGLMKEEPPAEPNDTQMIVEPAAIQSTSKVQGKGKGKGKDDFKVPRMPLKNSEIFKNQIKQQVMEDASVNTASGHDVAGEIAKHVTTLKKISLIAEEFNQKTAKNLKEIVDSVQEDLLKKLDEIRQAEYTLIKPKSKLSVTIVEEK